MINICPQLALTLYKIHYDKRIGNKLIEVPSKFMTTSNSPKSQDTIKLQSKMSMYKSKEENHREQGKGVEATLEGAVRVVMMSLLILQSLRISKRIILYENIQINSSIEETFQIQDRNLISGNNHQQGTKDLIIKWSIKLINKTTKT